MFFPFIFSAEKKNRLQSLKIEKRTQWMEKSDFIFSTKIMCSVPTIARTIRVNDFFIAENDTNARHTAPFHLFVCHLDDVDLIHLVDCTAARLIHKQMGFIY